MKDIIVLLFVLCFVVYFLLCILPAYMADKRGRNAIGWFLLSLFVTPICTTIIILCLGETNEKRKERIWQEEEWKILCRKLNANKDNHEN